MIVNIPVMYSYNDFQYILLGLFMVGFIIISSDYTTYLHCCSSCDLIYPRNYITNNSILNEYMICIRECIEFRFIKT